jgi:hypothetical protein
VGSVRARRWSLGQSRARSWRAAGAVLLGGVLGGCSTASSSSGTACNQDPSICGAGQTCWVERCSCPSTPNQSTACKASACTQFDFECLPGQPAGLPGQNCDNTIGKVTCGAGQACVQEMDAGGGFGVCAAYCDPTAVGSCAPGYSCVEVGVGLLKGSPVIHVCQLTMSDASFPTVGVDAGGPPPMDSGGITDGPTMNFRDVVLP